jgi:signal peptidase I
MALYGENRDVSLFRHLNRELINNIIEQKVGYYKINLDKTPANMYGESAIKTYNDPVLLNCLIERGDTDPKTDDFGMDVTRNMKFRFLRDDLVGIDLSTELGADGKGFTYNIVPEVGDVVLWNNDYYEVNNANENQLIVGKDPLYSYASQTDSYGSSWSIIVECFYIRPEKLGITQQRL